jgi:hypothetical protein
LSIVKVFDKIYNLAQFHLNHLFDLYSVYFIQTNHPVLASAMRHNVAYPNHNNLFPNSNSSGQPSVNIFNSNNQPQQGNTSSSSMPSTNLWTQQRQGVSANSQAPSNIFTNNRSEALFLRKAPTNPLAAAAKAIEEAQCNRNQERISFRRVSPGTYRVVSGPQTGGVNIFNTNIANQSPNIQQPRGPQDQNNQNPQNHSPTDRGIIATKTQPGSHQGIPPVNFFLC